MHAGCTLYFLILQTAPARFEFVREVPTECRDGRREGLQRLEAPQCWCFLDACGA